MSRHLHERVANISNALIVSPHLDDGVFSCGAFMAEHTGCTVLTVFAGAPDEASMQTEWDKKCGFENALVAWRVRRAEDCAATSSLNADCEWLNFVDDQYAPDQNKGEIAPAILECAYRLHPSAVFVPMGLFHSDHLRVSAACLDLVRQRAISCCIAYEDALYRRKAGAVQERMVSFAAGGVLATPVSPMTAAPDCVQKRNAVSQYNSQLRAFGWQGFEDLFMPERYWLIERNHE
ncbi:MAG TPA: PIG-L family deacetylase [Rhodocyclaceae bacterium]|nr:PIG-L family deacetylase [Rhodocyclaceae bacterium]